LDKEHTMLTRKILSTLVALSVGAGGVAFGQGNPRAEDFPQWQQGADRQPVAQAPGYQNGHGPDRSVQRGQADQKSSDRNYHGDPHNSYQGDSYHGNQRDGYRGHEGRGAGPQHTWYRGDRLPPQYNSRSYVVDDWRGHHLSAPPRGYHWVQSGGDYVLVAIATGIIASILLNQ
jgi:Ni/Co efflux regulator RcnB